MQSFRSKDSIKIVNQIIKKSEQIINDISKELAVGQLDFVSRDVDESAEKINKIQQNVQALKKKIKTKNPEHPEESTEIDDLQLKLDKLSIELDSATAAYKSALSAQKIVRAEAVQNLKKTGCNNGTIYRGRAKLSKKNLQSFTFLVHIWNFVLYNNCNICGDIEP